MRPVLLALLAAGCMRQQPLPFVGDCAVYPDGTYEYGQIGIGRCLSGPTDLAFAGDPDDPTLLVTNANPFVDFTGGSLLAIPWNQIDRSVGRNIVSELDSAAVDLPSFAGALAVSGDVGVVGVRLSEDARTRTAPDELWLIDLSAPGAPSLSTLGTDGGAQLEVGADPVDVVWDEGTGLAYVANRTDHSVSVVDTTASPFAVVPPWQEAVLTTAAFHDADGSGSTAGLVDLSSEDSTLLTDDAWTLTWSEGTWITWVPGDDGAWRASSPGDGTWRRSAMGVEVDPADSEEIVGEVRDPSWFPGDPGRLFYADDGAIRSVWTDSYLGDWLFEELALLDVQDDGDDARLSGPSAVTADDLLYLFYGTAQADGTPTGIGAATSADGLVFSRLDGPLLSPLSAHEADRIADPSVVYDGEAGVWRMVYGAFDGDTWTIGQAWSADLLSWTQDELPVFAPEGAGAAAPVLSFEVGSWRMLYARWQDGAWSVAEARSPDGQAWTDLGTVLEVDLAAPDVEAPPGPAMAAFPDPAFRVAGEAAGSLLTTWPAEASFDASSYGWMGRALAGWWLDAGDAGPDSAGGLRVDSVDSDAGLAWLTLWDAGGTPRIGVAELRSDGVLLPRRGAVFSGGSSFDGSGVSSPVVYADGAGWTMLYAGTRGPVTTIGRATSLDGITWTSEGAVISAAADWDSVALIPGSLSQTEDGLLRLWFTGTDGSTRRIGSAVSSDGVSWTRETGSRDWIFGPGAPGDWDDSGTADPFVRRDADGEHLWYAGFDGDVWQGGYAFRAAGSDEWVSARDPLTDEPRAVIGATGGLFHPDGVRRPIVLDHPDGGYDLYYAGLADGVARVGRARGQAEDRIHKTPQRPTAGDTLRFSTERGDADALAIPLDQTVDGQSIVGVGLTALALDADRGFVYAASKLLPYLVVLDVRDDSDESTGFVDRNYLDIEAVLVVTTSGGATGFRQVVPIPGSDRVYALNDSPEAVYVMSVAEVEDDDVPDVLYESLQGYLPASRGDERDVGVATQMSIGPAQMAIHPDGRHLFVTNFNTNSLLVYDLDLGPAGELVSEVLFLGENPYAIAFAPDGRSAVVANYLGETLGETGTSATLVVIDTDRDSPTWLEPLTWIANL
jgi:DNA-binding beta-propeller fold protein YncE